MKAKINEKYVAVYMQYQVMGYAGYDEIETAIKFLKDGSDSNLLLPIAVIETETKAVGWKANYFPNTEKKQIKDFIENYL